jgi:hypothetical protein
VNNSTERKGKYKAFCEGLDAAQIGLLIVRHDSLLFAPHRGWSAPLKTIPRELTSDTLGVINVNTNEKRVYGERS